MYIRREDIEVVEVEESDEEVKIEKKRVVRTDEPLPSYPD